jgi:hypothetical protein
MTDLRSYQRESSRFEQLSLKDLLQARDQYHIHLMRHPNVVATAVGRYRIRKKEGWPKDHGVVHAEKGERTLVNSEVRPYSWPTVLVFVDKWEEPDAFGGKDSHYRPYEMVPRTLYLPDGREVPVCVILAPRQARTDVTAPPIRYPLNNIGGGYPVVADVQGQSHVATIACLVGDGHKVYALTNRHVAGDAGEVVYAQLGGKQIRIGVSSGKQLTRLPFTDLYPGWPGRDTFVNLDIGMVEVDDLDVWTAKIRDIGTMEPMADFAVDNLSLALIGCHVRGHGAASGVMLGEIHGLFYRYKSQGGFEYVADLFVGPRSNGEVHGKAQAGFATHPGDSGTLWLLEPIEPRKGAPKCLPLAMQWGQNTLGARQGTGAQTYALATLLSRVCALLTVDPIRDWNLDQPDTWGAVGHFSIAARTEVALSGAFPKLSALIKNNRDIIGHDDATILNDDFKGMGDADFVPLADVPDFYWKHGKQGASRGSEGPNHFADMDQSGPGGQTLLDMSAQPEGIDPDRWNQFYDQVTDLLTGDPVSAEHRGLLPFRVWQIFDEMVTFVKDGDGERFLCAAGVLAHYIGDACQPLHISYLHDGDPEQPATRTVHHRNGTTDEVNDPLGKGVHSAYEDEMVNAFREQILDGLKQAAKKAKKTEYVANGFEAAQRTIGLMRATFSAIPPVKIVQTFVGLGKGKRGRAEAMWNAFGDSTIDVMRDGCHLLAVLWESAWSLGDGEHTIGATTALSQQKAMEICADREFLPSLTIDRIGAKLTRPAAAR